jgi:hypothetical protein
MPVLSEGSRWRNMRMPVFVPGFITPPKNRHLCECKQKPVDMEYKKEVLHWRMQCGTDNVIGYISTGNSRKKDARQTDF